MKNIQQHTLLMRNEVQLEHIQEENRARLRSLEHFEATEKAHRKQEYWSIRTDVSPKTYESRLDWFHGRFCTGTDKWLKKDTTFARWIDSSDTSTKVLWLQGIPGAGMYTTN